MGGTGDFKRPAPPGPTIGPTKHFDELDQEQQIELGGLDKLKAPIGTSATPPAEEQREPDVAAQAEEGAEKLEALQAVLAPEEELPNDDLRTAAVPTEDDRQEFMRCLLGNRAYTKRYELFGGMLIITFRDIPPSEEDRLFAVMAQQQGAGEIKTDDDWDVVMDRLRLAVNVESMIISGQPKITNPVDAAGDIVGIAQTQVMAAFKSSVTYRAALRTLRIFKLHLEWLLERSLDSDFWRADGPGSLLEPTSDELLTTNGGQS